MSNTESKLVENLLSKPEVHEKWEGDYRTTENESFYEQAFDYILCWGVLMHITRQADVGWLERSFGRHGLSVERRVAGQFSEAYAMVSAAPLKRLVHGFNSSWFRRVRSPGPAYGNILFLRKRR